MYLLFIVGAEVYGVRRTVGYMCTTVRVSVLVHTCSIGQIADMCQNDAQPHRRLNRQNTSLCWDLAVRSHGTSRTEDSTIAA